MRVIAKSGDPEEFYKHELDGPATYQLLARPVPNAMAGTTR